MSERRIEGRARRNRGRLFADRSGSVAIEFSIVFPMFAAILLAIVQLAIIYFAKAELISATQTVGRQVFTGNAATTEANFQTALCANLPVIIQCSGVMINLQPQASLSNVSTAPPALTYDGAGNVTNTFTYNPGTNSQVMVLQVMYQLPVVAGYLFDFASQSNGSILLVATYVFENEPQ
jgi:Flp pilus assembly protein TadG